MGHKYIIAAVAALLCCAAVSAQTKKPEAPDINQIAENEADRLERLLDLEAWQTFYVDSTLKHNWEAMTKEIEELRSSKVANTSIYIAVQDKWAEKIDRFYESIFTEEQWRIYLKQGGKSAQKARDKRKAKLEKINSKKK